MIRLLLSIPRSLIGIFFTGIVTLNTLLVLPFIVFLAFLKTLPLLRLQKKCQLGLNHLCDYWSWINKMIASVLTDINVDSEVLSTLSKNKSYIVISNHQSWLDIVVLQSVLHLKVPALKFFLKDSLKWVPLLGICWWALDFPFMKRYSKAYLAKHPEKKGQDLAATQKACEKFKITPVSIMNYPEGTRLTREKHLKQNSPFSYLLKPKAGGIAYALPAIGSSIDSILDLSVAYPKDKTTLWDFLCGRVDKININLRRIVIPKEFYTMDYANDSFTREQFQLWLNERWLEKDLIIKNLLKKK